MFIEENYLVIDSVTNEVKYVFSRQVPQNSAPYDSPNDIVIKITKDFANSYRQNIIDGKHYKLKDATGTTIETMLIEFTPEVVASAPSLIDRVQALEEAQLGSLGI